ncbi:MAG: hypothetical protein ABIO44_05385 [Saprospiraceae bacterium]
MINLELLDKIVEDFEKNPAQFDKVLEKVEADNLALFDMLLGSHAEILNDDEMDYLVFLFIIIYEASSTAYNLSKIEEEPIERMDESTWEIINEYNDFEKCYDHIEKDFIEKELLEFIYVSIENDDEKDYDITESGRLVMLSVLITESKLLCQISNAID